MALDFELDTTRKDAKDDRDPEYKKSNFHLTFGQRFRLAVFGSCVVQAKDSKTFAPFRVSGCGKHGVYVDGARHTSRRHGCEKCEQEFQLDYLGIVFPL